MSLLVLLLSVLFLAPPGSAHADDADTLTIERVARETGRGLWAGCFVTPWDFRKTNKKAVLLGAACSPDAHARLFPDDPRMPPGCPIKAKYARRALLTGHRGIYHPPGCRSYRTTKNPDRWFCSEEDARAAGFRAPLNRWFR